jgi:uncharacterized protein (TIGR02001 family)
MRGACRKKVEEKRMMKMMTSVVAVAVMASSVAFAADTSLSLDVASAYVFRGDTFNDGLVAQPGLEVALPAGFSVGAWGNIDLDDYNGTLANDDQFSEIDIYGSYAVPVEVVDLSIGYCEYTYPTSESVADREVSVSVGTSVGIIDLGLGVYYGIDGGIEKSLYADVSAGTSFELAEGLSLDLGATAGYLDPDEGESGLKDYTLSAGLGYGILGASVTYIGQLDDDVLVDIKDGGTYDADVVGMLSIASDF